MTIKQAKTEAGKTRSEVKAFDFKPAIVGAKAYNAAHPELYPSKLVQEIKWGAHKIGYVSTRWERHSRNFYTITEDLDYNQVGDAHYTGELVGAVIAHVWAVQKAVEVIRHANA